MESLTIGKVARLARVGVETIRFYERRGLLEEPPRRPSGYRQYPEETVSRIRFIKRAKGLGFTLKEIEELLSLRVDSASTCEDVRQRAEGKIVDIKRKIGTLQNMERALVKLVSACQNRSPMSKCPIIEALDQDEN